MATPKNVKRNQRRKQAVKKSLSKVEKHRPAASAGRLTKLFFLP